MENSENRRVGVAMDYSSTSKSALKWTANNLLKDGDHLVLIHVQPPNSDTPTKLLFQDTGSRIPLFSFLFFFCFTQISFFYMLVFTMTHLVGFI